MDIILEITDTFLFDRLYATFLPTAPDTVAYNSLKHASPNATFTSLREVPTAYADYSFEPATQWLSFQPSNWAYMSQWPRDNVYRQAISLYLITVYQPSFKHFPRVDF